MQLHMIDCDDLSPATAGLFLNLTEAKTLIRTGCLLVVFASHMLRICLSHSTAAAAHSALTQGGLIYRQPTTYLALAGPAPVPRSLRAVNRLTPFRAGES